MECFNDLVVEKEVVRVCTTFGWGPTELNETNAENLSCLPNACPNILDKKIKNGEWRCISNNKSRSCKNNRVGEVCTLKCNGKFKVSHKVTVDSTQSPFIKAGLGYVSVCTSNGWLPSPEDLRCYGYQITSTTIV